MAQLFKSGNLLLRDSFDMNNSPSNLRQRDESPSAVPRPTEHNSSMFQILFERSADGILLVDPKAGVFVDCNQAAVELMRAGTKEELLQRGPEDFSPPIQPDGTPTSVKNAECIAMVAEHGSHRFEWLGRRLDGQEVPMEVLVTLVQVDGRGLNVSVVRDITERKRTEAALRQSEQMFRGLFEASSDGILILDPVTRRNVDCNAASIRMAGGGGREWILSEPIENLAPDRQPDGQLSSVSAQTWIDRALADGPQRFEWGVRQKSGIEWFCSFFGT